MNMCILLIPEHRTRNQALGLILRIRLFLFFLPRQIDKLRKKREGNFELRSAEIKRKKQGEHIHLIEEPTKLLNLP